MISIGEKAPTFNAQAFYNRGFSKLNMMDYKEKWIKVFFTEEISHLSEHLKWQQLLLK